VAASIVKPLTVIRKATNIAASFPVWKADAVLFAFILHTFAVLSFTVLIE
jgi:hypothetical protein